MTGCNLFCDFIPFRGQGNIAIRLVIDQFPVSQLFEGAGNRSALDIQFCGNIF